MTDALSGFGRRDTRTGRRMAMLFRTARVAADVRACDLDTLCLEDELEVLESRVADPGYTACLMCGPPGEGGLISLAPGQEGGRRRFSIAHELGHYHIPTHRAAREDHGFCGDADMRADGASAAIEWEANDFASELLMPTRRFGVDVARRDLSVATAQELASDALYAVSVTAAAWRMVQLAQQPCAVVVTANGLIEWAVRSESFRIPGLRRGDPLSNESLAATTHSSGEGEPQPLEVEVYAWLEPRYPVRERLLESTHALRRSGQVLSLLWLAERDYD